MVWASLYEAIHMTATALPNPTTRLDKQPVINHNHPTTDDWTFQPLMSLTTSHSHSKLSFSRLAYIAAAFCYGTLFHFTGVAKEGGSGGPRAAYCDIIMCFFFLFSFVVVIVVFFFSFLFSLFQPVNTHTRSCFQGPSFKAALVQGEMDDV
ncbi:hypothetical protein ACJBU6_10295 [Exserohilum turcicum]